MKRFKAGILLVTVVGLMLGQLALPLLHLKALRHM